MWRIARTFLLVPFVALFCGCGNKSSFGTDGLGVRLGDGLVSYQTVEEAKTEITKRLGKWEIIEDSATPRRRGRPEFTILRASVGNFEHLGHRGELILEFLNDRLMAIRFFPAQTASDYLLAVSKAEGVVLQPRGSTVAPAFRRIWHGIDHRGKEYVGWEDTRLSEEYSRWIRKYA